MRSPAFGDAISVTVEPVAKVPEQPLAGQRIVESLLESMPETIPGPAVPTGLIVTFNVADGVTVPVTEKVNVGFAASFVVTVIVAVNVPDAPAGGLEADHKLAHDSAATPGKCKSRRVRSKPAVRTPRFP